MTKWLCVMALMAGCGAQVGTGSLTVTASGEDGAKEGFPVEEDGESIAFADGWSLSFSKYLVSVGKLSVSAADGESAVVSSEVSVVDLSKGDPLLGSFEDVPARRWDRFSFEIVTPAADAVRGEGVSTEDVALMNEAGFTYWMEGEATRGDETVTFAWGFAAATKNADCTNGDDGKAGVVIGENSSARAQITFHVEHAFWDSLGADDSTMRFDPIAALADEDGHVSLEALASQSLARPLDAEGQPIKAQDGSDVVYDPGSMALSENNLRGFMTASIASQAHLNGEGLCTLSKL